ncbi:hypothetical protein DACRYDRAFT_111957 [Dacryopinax primogenitus]|uniref:Replication factor-A protein 1 N-terminal domain-containing protein n=1 Tax=Dacryopinax primogenitus (strain DJM 731) TaxID=1858805 RepID=M5G0V2_DACPD|nr:uncharacterized protein DACRYDRAFT_111957 [Dacryopinax primogenitus]EJT97417.1 hypothetical protein DACRYDRAFT_111957 [Dacryopinax primogenitus]
MSATDILTAGTCQNLLDSVPPVGGMVQCIGIHPVLMPAVEEHAVRLCLTISDGNNCLDVVASFNLASDVVQGYLRLYDIIRIISYETFVCYEHKIVILKHVTGPYLSMGIIRQPTMLSVQDS